MKRRVAIISDLGAETDDFVQALRAAGYEVAIVAETDDEAALRRSIEGLQRELREVRSAHTSRRPGW